MQVENDIYKYYSKINIVISQKWQKKLWIILYEINTFMISTYDFTNFQNLFTKLVDGPTMYKVNKLLRI